MISEDATPAPTPAPMDAPGRLLAGILRSVVLNALVPVLIYTAAKRYWGASEFHALVWATVFPVMESAWGLWREHEMDPIAGIVLFGILVDAAALSLGGSPKILLIRESFATGALGAACFLSLLFPRPLMFYFGRYFIGGRDPLRRRRYEQSWAIAEVRHGNRLITSIWGLVFTGELALRVLLVYTLPAAAVLVISPVLLGVLTVVTIVWTIAYARRMRARVLPRLLRSGG
ncbi:MAG TPA: VC0807 family protein [Terriglobales bacterium]|nr:VC0807 family protein [Terriglobales bacterium]